eukprot:SAG31_NODE_74_length_27628_cov_18.235642_28_plen_84_part_00
MHPGGSDTAVGLSWERAGGAGGARGCRRGGVRYGVTNVRCRGCISQILNLLRCTITIKFSRSKTPVHVLQLHKFKYAYEYSEG